MGTYLFKWDRPGNEVHVTGTFDDWGKTVLLEKKGNLHEKLVTLPTADEKILFKFVVDGHWTTDTSMPSETDKSGNTNNVLHPSDISKATISQQVSAMISNVTGNTTTQGLAGQTPKEGDKEIPGSFPETPAAGQSDVKVDPIPATAGAGNPVSLIAGEPVPPASSITHNTISSTATTDQASYGKAAGAPILPNVVTPEGERSAGLFGLPEKSKNMIPESSLPIVGGGVQSAAINSAGANSTTAQLAGQVPLEPKSNVPEVVKESQHEANASAEASANPEAVKEKTAMEKELEQKVPEEPATAESTIGGKAAATIGAAAAGATAAFTGVAAYVSSGQATEDAKAHLPESAQNAVDKVVPNGAAASHGAPEDGTVVAAGVPNVVGESLAEAHQSPEAAANKTAVQEKDQVEADLLSSVKKDNSAGEPAPVASAETSATVPQPTTTKTEEPVRDTARSTTESAAATTAAATAAAGAGTGGVATGTAEQQPKTLPDSRDISPMTRPDGTHAQPTVTTGVASASTATKSSPVSSPMSPKSQDADDKKAKRRSGFFSKLKEKVQHKKHQN